MNPTLPQTLGLIPDQPVGLHAYLVVAAILFVLGVIACLTRRNAIGILIGIELIMNAGIINFMAFWHFRGGLVVDGAMSGPIFGVFAIVMAACEAAVALAILLNLYFNFGSVNVDKIQQMKH
ncbi:MAG: NADH-quinone oxidoreductase subunit [Candidatus Hydrogenedentes bacterium]|nr:NADH-quinone oxidoreductase subunit [Candidatus Hydrogenedentota bacterium]